jgi:hypothetical protein
MILKSYSVYKEAIFFEKKVTGYFIERFLHFNYQKNKNFKFSNKYISFNSNKINYFDSRLQCFFKVKKEKLSRMKNIVSRINLLKLRFEFPETLTSYIYRFELKILSNDPKTYGSFNSLSLIPRQIDMFSNSKFQVILKKLFSFDPNKLYSINWYCFFGNLRKIAKINISKIVHSIFGTSIALFTVVNKVIINKLILNFNSQSWLNGFISLINHERKIYSKKNTLLYLRLGILKLNQSVFSRFLKKNKSNRFSFRKNACISFSVDPIFGQIIPVFNNLVSNLLFTGIYGFKILASKKKLPLKLFTSFSSNLNNYNFFFNQESFRHNIKKIIQDYRLQKGMENFVKFTTPTNNLPTNTLKNVIRKDKSIFNQLIIKEASDFDKELGAIFLLSQIEKILREYQIDTWLNPLSFNNYFYNGGTIEVIPNSKSIHEIKSRSFLKILTLCLEKNVKTIKEKNLIENFLQSLAGYSLFCYLLQIKDRHNANILLNEDRRIIHVDFAFILGSLPGNLKLEATSFKMSEDFISLIKGKNSQSLDQLKEIFTRGFLILKKSIGKIVKVSKFFILEGEGKNKTSFRLSELIKRFDIKFNDLDSIRSSHLVFNDSLEDWRTEQYDKYQLLASGIKI